MNIDAAVTLVINIYRQPAREYIAVIRKLSAAAPDDNTYTLELRARELENYFISDPYCLFQHGGKEFCEQMRRLARSGGTIKWKKLSELS